MSLFKQPSELEVGPTIKVLLYGQPSKVYEEERYSIND